VSKTCEVSKYLAAEVDEESMEEAPEYWWRKKSAAFPTLAPIALPCLTQSASSVAVESMFSTMGILLNARRSSLAPHTSEMVLFIHDNYSLYFP
jgi:hypothetical protein